MRALVCLLVCLCGVSCGPSQPETPPRAEAKFERPSAYHHAPMRLYSLIESVPPGSQMYKALWRDRDLIDNNLNTDATQGLTVRFVTGVPGVTYFGYLGAGLTQAVRLEDDVVYDLWRNALQGKNDQPVKLTTQEIVKLTTVVRRELALAKLIEAMHKSGYWEAVLPLGRDDLAELKDLAEQIELKFESPPN